jgi:hypothetical protein
MKVSELSEGQIASGLKQAEWRSGCGGVPKGGDQRSNLLQFA